MKIKSFVLTCLCLCGMAVASGGAWAQTIVSEGATELTTLLAAIDAKLMTYGVFILVLLVMACGLGLLITFLIYRCCRKGVVTIHCFGKTHVNDFVKETGQGMYKYDLQKETLQAFGPACKLLGLTSGKLSLGEYQRLAYGTDEMSAASERHCREIVRETAGGAAFVMLYICPVPNRRGQMAGEYGWVQDITIHRRREIASGQKNAALQSALDKAKDNFTKVEQTITKNQLHAMIFHRDFDIIKMNAAAIDILGPDEDKEIGKCLKQVMAGPAMIRAFGEHLVRARANKIAIGRFTVYDKNHNPVEMEIFTNVFDDSDNENVFYNSSLRIVDYCVCQTKPSE